MSNLIRISVVIPTYNRSKLLLQAVESVLEQTYPIEEILICDDGSTDDSKQKIEKLQNPKIRWIDCGRNGAPAIPRNTGIIQSTGDWVAFLDSDDSWLPTKLYEQVKCIQSTSCLAVSTNASRFAGEINMGNYLIYKKDVITLIDLFWRNPVIISSLLVHKPTLLRTELFPVSRQFDSIEDYALNLKVASLTTISFIEKPLVRYFDIPSLTLRGKQGLSFYEQRKRVTGDLLSWVRRNNITFSLFDRILLYFLNSPIVKAKFFLVKLLRSVIKP